MTYTNKLDFIKNEKNGIRKIGKVEYIHELVKQGFDKTEIQSKMLLDKVSKSAHMLRKDFNDYEKVKDKVEWI
mgnify:CR=1 FL=1|tara:strand:+ start:334 stop:552 length:219 start_codon:yes stop_codon:yes gene_type:complete